MEELNTFRQSYPLDEEGHTSFEDHGEFFVVSQSSPEEETNPIILTVEAARTLRTLLNHLLEVQ